MATVSYGVVCSTKNGRKEEMFVGVASHMAEQGWIKLDVETAIMLTSSIMVSTPSKVISQDDLQSVNGVNLHVKVHQSGTTQIYSTSSTSDHGNSTAIGERWF